MKVAMITAGSAGMYCGSCMHDNTLAAALQARGVSVQLIPTYTPLRTDEEDVSVPRVFLGGINMYLEQKLPWWPRVPVGLRRWLDSPRLLKTIGQGRIETDPAQLGDMTVSVLRGDQGNQASEIHQLVDYIVRDAQPEIVVLSNALLVGIVPLLKRRWPAPILCTLQGDDVFLEGLAEPYRQESLRLLRQQVSQFDGFLVHSLYYREFMAGYLGIDRRRMHRVTLGLNLNGYPVPDMAAAGGGSDSRPRGSSLEATRSRSVASTGDTARDRTDCRETSQGKIESRRPYVIGYFARICPEKGLHVLVDAVGLLRRQAPECRLRVGGYLAPQHRGYFHQLGEQARRQGWELEYDGALDRIGKMRFLAGLDVLSVPTVYREPKGLYVLEALASGVPVVQPRHGAFPELIEATGGGLLVSPQDPEDLAQALLRLRDDPATRDRLAQSGQRAVHQRYNSWSMAEETLTVFHRYVKAQDFPEGVSSSDWPAWASKAGATGHH